MTIWEEHGFSIEDYAQAFHKALDEALDEAWERQLKNKIYFVQFDPNKSIKRIALLKNIKVNDNA